ncbi:hypothetical protein ABIA39_006305 [Nocardia sp. GAS34]
MTTGKLKILAVTALALSLGVLAAPATAAPAMATSPVAVTSHQATPIGGGGSLHICFPLGSFVWCI